MKDEKKILIIAGKGEAEQELSILQKNGFDLVLAYCGKSGLDEIRKQKVDLIMMDIDNDSGSENCRSARSILEKFDLPVLFLTGNTDDEIFNNTGSIESYGYIKKNSDENFLLMSVRTAMRLHEASKRVRESEYWLMESQRVSMVGSYLLDFSTGLWTSSDVLDEIFGIGPEYERSIEGWLGIVSPEERAAMAEYFQNEVKGKGIDFDREYPIISINSGEKKWVHGKGKLLFDDSGTVLKMTGTIQDITERKLDRDRLSDSLAEKNALLLELKHRIKNSFAIVTGMVYLEAERHQDQVLRESLMNVWNRMNSLANLYDLLHSSKEITEIRLDHYIEKLCASLMGSYLPNRELVSVKLDLDKIKMVVNSAISVGLIVNELVTNSVKYAFPGRKSGVIEVAIKKVKGGLILSVSDNGIGMKPGIESRHGMGFGLELVEMLVKQLDGSLIIGTGTGSSFIIKIPLVKSR